MEVAEIKVSYSNNNVERIKVTNSQILYNLVVKQWDLDLIEFQEEVKIVLLNRANIVLGIYEMSKGGTSGTVVDIKIILGIALKCNASNIVITHNHPSGALEPSEPDKLITKKLKEACRILDLNLLDHLIITRQGYYSFSDNCIL
ncbi:JAB domain-containing protein [Flavobacterium phragmitis]|uniref:RadC-like JAB domain-containing protein n=1 Tax=Flavobacterium phragmitis TaxID=739143 RepID=A0A1I1RUJ1_9FLAO|nr:JAB domain-containing protein [Flavobacterium phragmitis]SFD37925.1 RadC-like JAB domain-containing protein [Flavobacterium phragmitis]